MILLLVLAGAGTAGAATKTLWLSDTYAPLVQSMSGVADEKLDAEDDATEWAAVTQSVASADILGFTCPFDVTVGDLCYHRVFVAPCIR